MVLYREIKRISHPPTLRLLFFKHLKQKGYVEYAFIKIELLFSTVACKPKIGSWSWVDGKSVIGGGGGGLLVTVGCVETEKPDYVEFSFPPCQDVQSPQGCWCRLLGCMWRVWPRCFVDVCIANSSIICKFLVYFKIPPPPSPLPVGFMFRCLCGGKKNTFTAILIV